MIVSTSPQSIGYTSGSKRRRKRNEQEHRLSNKRRISDGLL